MSYYNQLNIADKTVIIELASGYEKIGWCDNTFLTTLGMANWSCEDANKALVFVKEYLNISNS